MSIYLENIFIKVPKLPMEQDTLFNLYFLMNPDKLLISDSTNITIYKKGNDQETNVITLHPNLKYYLKKKNAIIGFSNIIDYIFNLKIMPYRPNGNIFVNEILAKTANNRYFKLEILNLPRNRIIYNRTLKYNIIRCLKFNYNFIKDFLELLLTPVNKFMDDYKSRISFFTKNNMEEYDYKNLFMWKTKFILSSNESWDIIDNIKNLTDVHLLYNFYPKFNWSYDEEAHKHYFESENISKNILNFFNLYQSNYYGQFTEPLQILYESCYIKTKNDNKKKILLLMNFVGGGAFVNQIDDNEVAYKIKKVLSYIYIYNLILISYKYKDVKLSVVLVDGEGILATTGIGQTFDLQNLKKYLDSLENYLNEIQSNFKNNFKFNITDILLDDNDEYSTLNFVGIGSELKEVPYYLQKSQFKINVNGKYNIDFVITSGDYINIVQNLKKNDDYNIFLTMAGDPVGPGNHYYSWTSATNASEENNSRRMIDPFFPVMFMNDIYSFFKINSAEDSTITISEYIINISQLLDTDSSFNELNYDNIKERIIIILKNQVYRKIIFEAIINKIKSLKKSKFYKDLKSKEEYKLTYDNFQDKILFLLDSKYKRMISDTVIEKIKFIKKIIALLNLLSKEEIHDKTLNILFTNYNKSISKEVIENIIVHKKYDHLPDDDIEILRDYSQIFNEYSHNNYNFCNDYLSSINPNNSNNIYKIYKNLKKYRESTEIVDSELLQFNLI